MAKNMDLVSIGDFIEIGESQVSEKYHHSSKIHLPFFAAGSVWCSACCCPSSGIIRQYMCCPKA